jgi:hypothetical protein
MLHQLSTSKKQNVQPSAPISCNQSFRETSSSRSTLKEAEPRVLIKKLFGTECMAVQLVLSINKFRFKDGRGDPKGFTTGLLDAGLPKGLIDPVDGGDS